MDAVTKAPIPFVSISLLLEDVGALSDEAGYFHIITSAHIMKDSLLVRSLGYKPRIISVELDKANDWVVELSAADRSNTKLLSELPVITGLPGNQYAFYFNRKHQERLGKLNAVSFYVGYRGILREEFRLRLYNADRPNHSPKTDMLFEPVVVNGFKPGAWNTVDLRSFNIDFPDGGFYLVLEYLTGSGGPNHVSYLDALPASGIILNPSIAVKECRIWIQGPGHWDFSKGKRGDFIFDTWTLKSISCAEFQMFGNAIKVEVERTE
ncbi:hypothetical protein GCM10022409_17850 [Hymenobacter glaciei]|uniref:Carboxypeptidase-like regulatory domain-containing protein n=1 Tax=Hymenobacter glaciei TaxID=877209 RepID=A0ABP7U0D7_9BACT